MWHFGSGGGNYEEFRLLKYDALHSDSSLTTFRRTLLSPFSGCKSEPRKQTPSSRQNIHCCLLLPCSAFISTLKIGVVPPWTFPGNPHALLLTDLFSVPHRILRHAGWPFDLKLFCTFSFSRPLGGEIISSPCPPHISRLDSFYPNSRSGQIPCIWQHLFLFRETWQNHPSLKHVCIVKL
jgi:hypothetical protein